MQRIEVIWVIFLLCVVMNILHDDGYSSENVPFDQTNHSPYFSAAYEEVVKFSLFSSSIDDERIDSNTEYREQLRSLSSAFMSVVNPDKIYALTHKERVELIRDLDTSKKTLLESSKSKSLLLLQYIEILSRFELNLVSGLSSLEHEYTPDQALYEELLREVNRSSEQNAVALRKFLTPIPHEKEPISLVDMIKLHLVNAGELDETLCNSPSFSFSNWLGVQRLNDKRCMHIAFAQAAISSPKEVAMTVYAIIECQAYSSAILQMHMIRSKRNNQSNPEPTLLIISKSFDKGSISYQIITDGKTKEGETLMEFAKTISLLRHVCEFYDKKMPSVIMQFTNFPKIL